MQKKNRINENGLCSYQYYIFINDSGAFFADDLNPRPTEGAIYSPLLVFLLYLLNQCRYPHQACRTLFRTNVTMSHIILKY